MKLVIHDADVSEVMSELVESDWPGLRLLDGDDFEALAPVETRLLARWEEEDRDDDVAFNGLLAELA